MALDIQAVKEIEQLKTAIAIEPEVKQKASVVEKPSATEKPSYVEKSSVAAKYPAVESPRQAEETRSGNGSIGISLIDLAEILDQHKQWVESGGEAGERADLTGVDLSKADLTGVNLQAAVLHRTILAGADLSMANLRGASLVRANLQNANLLGTELRGANLMGANVYGADGLWFGRLGGTNLFDAVLPESISAVDSSKAIGDATKVARWFYFLTVGLSFLCCLLIIYTTDVRLLLNSSALPFAKLGNLLPTTGLYLGGPIVLLILSLRFHFLLLRLWGSMAALPAVFPDGQTLEKDGPWYLMGLVRRHFRWQGESRAAMTAFESVLSTVLAYWIVPATLFFFWLRYLTRQDFRGTLLHVFLVTLAVATATSVPFVVSRVLRPGDIWAPKSKNVLRMVLGTLRAALAVGCMLLVISVGVNRGLPSDRTGVAVSAADPRRWAATIFQSVGYRPYADLTEASLSTPLPKGTPWTEENIEKISGAHLNEMNVRYARAYKAFLVNAKLWRANLEGIYLSEADLRGANLREGLLKSGIFDRALLSHAVLVSANATGANFASSDLRFSDLSYGTFENAVLSNARASGASFYAADLRNAQLLRTDLSRSDMRDARLEHSVLSFATLEQTDFSSGRLEDANLTGALCKGAIFLDADLKNADLRGASLKGAVLGGAVLDGANLTGADLRGVLGMTSLQVCSAVNGRTALMDADLAGEVQTHCGSSR
ncbi:MAG TPA: pentapeptide repeat-containing protein [Candidatus Acidoferrum sp.]|nr:pentapeptide repeat-containing protein [Candidatus Acidoferrum sp.]